MVLLGKDRSKIVSISKADLVFNVLPSLELKGKADLVQAFAVA